MKYVKIPTARSVFVVAFSFLLSVLSGLAIGIGFFPAVAIIVLPALMIIFASWLKGRSEFAGKILIILSFAYLALTPLWPRYVAFFIPGLPSVNPQRIVNFLLALVVFCAFFVSIDFKKSVMDSIKSNRFIWYSIFALFIVKLASVFISLSPPTSLYQLINELYVHFIFLPIGVYIASDRKRLLFVGKLMFFTVCLVFLSGVIEFVLKQNLFARFAGADNDYVSWAASEKMRGGVYRVQGTLGYPIIFGEYLALAFCISIVYLEKFKGWKALLLEWGALTFVAIGSLLCGSRSALGVSILLVLYLTLRAPVKRVVTGKVTLQDLTVWVASSLVVGLIFSVLLYLVYDRVFGSGNDAQSNLLRQIMYQRGYELALQSPLIGYGLGMAPAMVGVTLSAQGNYVLDSYYLSLLVDSGIFALLIYVTIFFALIRSLWGYLRNSNEEEVNFTLALITMLLVALAYKGILSVLDNHYMLYLAAGISLGLLSSSRRITGGGAT